MEINENTRLCADSYSLEAFDFINCKKEEYEGKYEKLEYTVIYNSGLSKEIYDGEYIIIGANKECGYFIDLYLHEYGDDDEYFEISFPIETKFISSMTFPNSVILNTNNKEQLIVKFKQR